MLTAPWGCWVETPSPSARPMTLMECHYSFRPSVWAVRSMSPGWVTDKVRPPRRRYPGVPACVLQGDGDMSRDVYTGMVTDGSAHLGNAVPGGTSERPKGQWCNIYVPAVPPGWLRTGSAHLGRRTWVRRRPRRAMVNTKFCGVCVSTWVVADAVRSPRNIPGGMKRPRRAMVL